MIARALHVLAHEPLDRGGVEDPRGAQPVGRQHLAQERHQRTAEPRPEGHADRFRGTCDTIRAPHARVDRGLLEAILSERFSDRSWFCQHRVELLVGGIVVFSGAYFFQGGGWNQNAQLATVVSIVERGTVYIDEPSRSSTGDVAKVRGQYVSNKAIGTPLLAVPGYVLARTLTLGIENHGTQVILRAYLTTVFTMGAALALGAVLIYRLGLRRLADRDAAALALGITLATPLFPNCIMLTAHPLAAVAALAGYFVLEKPRLEGGRSTSARLFAGGVLSALPMTFDYVATLVLLPLGAYALWQARRFWRIAWFAVGVLAVSAIPLTYHALVFGHPFRTAHAFLAHAGFAAYMNQGFFGFQSFSLERLFELTFGPSRGLFFLSPFLVAALPGWVRLIRERTSRAEGIVTGFAAWMIVLLLACLVYWHSGWSMGSRYALMFFVFAAVPVAAILPHHRAWILLAMVPGFVIMVLSASVTASPPEPGGGAENVVRWLWDHFAAGELAMGNEPILGVAAADPHIPFAFNLGTLMGLRGVWSVVPYLVVSAAACGVLLRVTSRP